MLGLTPPQPLTSNARRPARPATGGMQPQGGKRQRLQEHDSDSSDVQIVEQSDAAEELDLTHDNEGEGGGG